MKFVMGKTGETPRKTYPDHVSSTTEPTWNNMVLLCLNLRKETGSYRTYLSLVKLQPLGRIFVMMMPKSVEQTDPFLFIN